MEVLYKILIEFGIPRKLVRLTEMSMTETHSRVRVCKNVSDRFPIRNGLKQGDALSSLLLVYPFPVLVGRSSILYGPPFVLLCHWSTLGSLLY